MSGRLPAEEWLYTSAMGDWHVGATDTTWKLNVHLMLCQQQQLCFFPFLLRATFHSYLLHCWNISIVCSFQSFFLSFNCITLTIKRLKTIHRMPPLLEPPFRYQTVRKHNSVFNNSYFGHTTESPVLTRLCSGQVIRNDCSLRNFRE